MHLGHISIHFSHFASSSLLFPFLGGFVEQSQLLPPFLQAFYRLIVPFGKLRLQIFGNLDTHLLGSAHQRQANGSGGYSNELRIHALSFGNVIQFFQSDIPHGWSTISKITPFRQSCYPQEEPRCHGRTNKKLVGTICPWHQGSLDGHLRTYLGGAGIEVLAKGHHVDPQWSQGLAQFGCRFGRRTRHNQTEASDDGHDVDPPQGRKEINQRAAWQRKVLGKWVGIGKSKFFQGDYALMLPPSGSSWGFWRVDMRHALFLRKKWPYLTSTKTSVLTSHLSPRELEPQVPNSSSPSFPDLKVAATSISTKLNKITVTSFENCASISLSQFQNVPTPTTPWTGVNTNAFNLYISHSNMTPISFQEPLRVVYTGDWFPWAKHTTSREIKGADTSDVQ